MNQCPFIDTEIEPNPNFHERMIYTCKDGTEYIYYRHYDGFGDSYNCQFCKLIGRKRDIFECLNENEWKMCPYHRVSG